METHSVVHTSAAHSGDLTDHTVQGNKIDGSTVTSPLGEGLATDAQYDYYEQMNLL